MAEGIEKALSELNELKDKDLQTSDIEAVKKAIDGARNAAMKIGQSMNNQSSSSSSSSSSESSSSEGEKKEGENKN